MPIRSPSAKLRRQTITGASTVVTAAPTTTLVFDSTKTGSTTLTVDPSTTSTLTGVDINTSDSVSTPRTSSSPTSSSSGNVAVIPLGTVIGTCLAAFAGVCIIIGGAFFMYKRSFKPTRRARGPVSDSRAPRRERRRSVTGAGNWNQIADDKQDTWEHKEHARDESVGAMEKLTMFKKPAASLHSGKTGKRSFETNTFDAHEFDMSASPFAQYHAHQAQLQQPLPASRDFLGRLDVGSRISWDETMPADNSLHSLRAARLDSGAVSPPTVRALQTPTAVSVESFRWHSAEVEHFDAGSIQDTQSAYSTQTGGQYPNPFVSADEKGKGRAVNPFTDDVLPTPRRLPFADNHSDTGSIQNPTFSAAYQGLIEALDVPAAPLGKSNLRPVSTQGSYASGISNYSNEEEDITHGFPHPPPAGSRAARS